MKICENRRFQNFVVFQDNNSASVAIFARPKQRIYESDH